jgi:GMP synthase-like glutamine amidotransferase
VVRATILEHVLHEGPGRIAKALDRAGIEHHRLPLYAGAPLPQLADQDLLVVMGGPMGVGDRNSPQYPFLAGELELLEQAVRAGTPTLGVCLGAQLLAAAGGARVYPNVTGDPPKPTREVGWGAIHFVRTAAEEPVLAGLDRAEVVLHWHGDTFDLPHDATLLASTLSCENQMYRLGPRQFGLQFHVEIDEPDLEVWLQADASYVQGALGQGGAERIRRDARRFMPRFVERGDRLLEQLLAVMLA